MVHHSIVNILLNKIFVTTVLSLFLAQFIKMLVSLFINLLRPHKKLTWRNFLFILFWSTGGMPSSHSALVFALSTSIGLETSFQSPVYYLSLFFALIVSRDSLGVRYATGLQAHILNYVMDELEKRFDIPKKKLKEIKGHKPLDVIVGGILGVILSFSIYFLI